MNQHLLKLVRVSLQNSRDNGYDPDSTAVDELAIDLQRCDADIEHYSLEEIEECVRFLRCE
jgi:hypothetical protein